MITNEMIESRLTLTAQRVDDFFRGGADNICCIGSGMMLPRAMEELEQDGITISHLVDNTPEKIGQTIGGLIVVPEEDESVKDCHSYICTNGHVGLTRKKYERDGNKFISFSEYLIYRHFNECIEIREKYLVDDRSKLIFNVALYAQLTDFFDCDHTEYGEPNQYFAIPQFNLLLCEHFVDVGAYVGDSFEEMIHHSHCFNGTYIGFEPDEKNIKGFEARRNRLIKEWNFKTDQIEMIKAGVGDKTTVGVLDNSYSRSYNRIIESDDLNGINIVRLDDYLKDREVTFIKADVEGMERNVIRGAERIIAEQKPKLAICVYHLPWDIFEIPKMIKDINSSYRFDMRLHSKNYSELVLYCY
jgi:FkbM family methyltransferase